MRMIAEYRLKLECLQEIPMAIGAKPLCVGLDWRGDACIWCEVDPRVGHVQTKIAVVATGCDIPDWAHHYVGSFMLHAGMWHVYTR